MELDVEVDELKAGFGLLVILALMIGGTATSPMGDGTKVMVIVGQFVFIVGAFLVGMLHGEYRAGDGSL